MNRTLPQSLCHSPVMPITYPRLAAPLSGRRTKLWRNHLHIRRASTTIPPPLTITPPRITIIKRPIIMNSANTRTRRITLRRPRNTASSPISIRRLLTSTLTSDLTFGLEYAEDFKADFDALDAKARGRDSTSRNDGIAVFLSAAHVVSLSPRLFRQRVFAERSANAFRVTWASLDP